MFKQCQFHPNRAAVAAIFLVAGGVVQAQPMTCEELGTVIDEKQLEYNDHLLDLANARTATECLESVSIAFAESAAAQPVVDEASGESRQPPVAYPECAVVYEDLTADKVAQLLELADDDETEANEKIRATLLKIQSKKAGFDAGCN